jgi:hypothetical protein
MIDKTLSFYLILGGWEIGVLFAILVYTLT